MDIYFFNTLSGKKELFQPIKTNQVKIYTCGITVYDRCHIGHARGAVNFDVLRRFFLALDYQVTYVKNYTDIDDKLITRANETNQTVKELAEEMIQLHDQDMQNLNVLYPDIAPKATEHINEIIDLIKKLETNGVAYKSGNDVFFAVDKYNEYGKLSGKNLDELQAGFRIDVNDFKQNPFDFVLWKGKKEGEPFWESPWGDGRPGWHIECSAMSTKYLGQPFDIHAGGSDLIFPHHENELAQSCMVNHLPFVNYWLHNGMIRINNHKMSKSLNNFVCISDLQSKYPKGLLRFFILSTQYRKIIHFSQEEVERSLESLQRLYIALDRVQNIVSAYTLTKEEKNEFLSILADDLNTPLALAYVFEKRRLLNKTEASSEEAAKYYAQIMFACNILGILTEEPHGWLTKSSNQENKLSNKEIDQLVMERQKARTDKNWGEADRIRVLLDEQGILVQDEQDSTTWIRTASKTR